MPKPYFRFKQFTVFHNKCAMKVGTDGVLLGAWANINNAKRALDIGTGSGLIALMIAQRNDSVLIDAIDIDKDAIEQSNENIEQSPFSSRIKSIHMPIQDFAKCCVNKYDIIVSNPPFFDRSLKSPDKQRTLARHADSLNIEELITIATHLLTQSGNISVIYPHQEKNKLVDFALANGLHISRITNVHPTPSSDAKRVLMEFSKEVDSTKENSLTIERERHIYTNEFNELMKEFYLKM